MTRRLAIVMCVLALALPAAAPPLHATTAPAWDGTRQRIPAERKEHMRGVSWHQGCPVPLRDLRLLRMPYWGLDGEVYRGRMVVHERQAQKVLNIFERIYNARFGIRRMKLIEAYDGSDAKSMRANNTSAFNCRKVAGTDTWSEHAYGKAIDINPVQNPYVRGDTVQPAAGEAYLDRTDVREGMIVRPGPVVESFRIADWKWGGDWSSGKDYQHFSRSGR